MKICFWSEADKMSWWPEGKSKVHPGIRPSQASHQGSIEPALDLVNSEYLLIQSCDMCDLQSEDRDMRAAGLAPLSHVKETISGLSEMEAGRDSRFKLWTINKI